MLKKTIVALFAFFATSAVFASTPKYIFYYIGDGMGMGQVMAAEAYNRTVYNNTTPILMMQFPVASVATTYSASSPVTDSAAAGTALATGCKTKNGMLGMNADTVAVTSVAKQLFDMGYGIGLVTSVAPDDATPAAFYAHVPKRSMFYEIGKQAAESGYDFIGGANLRGTKGKDGKPNDLIHTFRKNGVDIVRGIDALNYSKSPRVLLLNTDSLVLNDIGYTIDSLPGVLTLPEMTIGCLNHLTKNKKDRFFMMVEGGNIDHAGHSNDAGCVIKEVLNFQQAIQAGYDFYLEHPDETLIVITADHETGGMGLGNNSVGYDLRLKAYESQRISKDLFDTHCRKLIKSGEIPTWEQMQQYLKDKLGFWGDVKLSDKQTEKLREAYSKCFESKTDTTEKTLYNNFYGFSSQVFKTLDSVTGMGWTTNAHSGGLVPVYAIGVGAEKFAGFNDNTDIPAIIRAIVGIQ